MKVWGEEGVGRKVFVGLLVCKGDQVMTILWIDRWVQKMLIQYLCKVNWPLPKASDYGPQPTATHKSGLHKHRSKGHKGSIKGHRKASRKLSAAAATAPPVAGSAGPLAGGGKGGSKTTTASPTSSTPAEVNWIKQGIVPPIRDQGYCGMCAV